MLVASDTSGCSVASRRVVVARLSLPEARRCLPLWHERGTVRHTGHIDISPPVA
jgi:hypothetical protein